MSKTPLIDEICRRINEKKKINSHNQIKSITLGHNAYYSLRIEVIQNGSGSFIVGKNCEYFCGYKLKQAPKRKNLIQVNLVGRGKRVWIKKENWDLHFIDYSKIVHFNQRAGDYQKMVDLTDKLKTLAKDYKVSFLTSSQKSVTSNL